MCIRNKWCPAHLPKDAFLFRYEWFYDQRIVIPKSNPINYTYKIILNGAYGLTNDKFSYFYDPLVPMSITTNGQLSLLMLLEQLCENVPGAKPLMINTDGLEVIIPREYQAQYMKICEEWETMTQLVLEHDTYEKLVLADVNSYIGQFSFVEVDKEEYDNIKVKNPHYVFKEEKGKYYFSATKCKGRFVFKDFDDMSVSILHKNRSGLIIPKAVYNYYIHDVPPEVTLQNNTNIFDYCIGVKIKGNWKFQERGIFKTKDLSKLTTQEVELELANNQFTKYNNTWKHPNLKTSVSYAKAVELLQKGLDKKAREYYEKDLQKTLRYYVSNNGCKIVKVNKSDGREIQVESGRHLLTIFNTYVEKPFKQYDVNESYYLKKIYKEINNISGKSQQIKLEL